MRQTGESCDFRLPWAWYVEAPKACKFRGNFLYGSLHMALYLLDVKCGMWVMWNTSQLSGCETWDRCEWIQVEVDLITSVSKAVLNLANRVWYQHTISSDQSHFCQNRGKDDKQQNSVWSKSQQSNKGKLITAAPPASSAAVGIRLGRFCSGSTAFRNQHYWWWRNIP